MPTKLREISQDGACACKHLSSLLMFSIERCVHPSSQQQNISTLVHDFIIVASLHIDARRFPVAHTWMIWQWCVCDHNVVCQKMRQLLCDLFAQSAHK